MTIISKTHLRVPMVKPADQKTHTHTHTHTHIYIYRERERVPPQISISIWKKISNKKESINHNRRFN
jgi:hypothetical protein